MTSARNSFSRPPGPQRRQEPRFEVHLPVTLHSSRNKEQLATWNVSFRGMFLVGEVRVPVRQLVRVGVFLPTTGRELVFHGMVVNHVLPDDPEGRPEGMGIELYALDPETRGAWWGLVRYVRDRLHELEKPSAVRLRLVPRNDG
jgi:hypothetical protein